jgi:SOS-response transcriptional repressor LexA
MLGIGINEIDNGLAQIHGSLCAALVPYCQGPIGRSQHGINVRYIRRMTDEGMFDRIHQRLEVLGMTERQASMLAVGNPDLVRNLKRNRSRSPRGASLSKLAGVLGVNESWLLGTSEDSALPALDKSREGVLFGGIVEAGAFRANDALDQDAELRRVDVAPDPRFPARSQYAFQVVGDSMTAANIYEGMHVLAVDLDAWERIRGAVPDGRLVVVARNRNGDPERELTVKKLRIFTDRIELQPQSGNPRHTPIIFPLPMQENSHGEAQILAVVLQAVRLY